MRSTLVLWFNNDNTDKGTSHENTTIEQWI
jgi:hypothetical protein